MRFDKFRTATLAIFAALAAAGSPAPSLAAPAPDDDAAKIHAKVRDWKPTPQERKLDLIGWAKGIREAKKLAQQSHRPVFIFTHNGNMNTGRC